MSRTDTCGFIRSIDTYLVPDYHQVSGLTIYSIIAHSGAFEIS